MCIQKKSSSVKITLLLKVDLEGFEPLTSRMRTERSPNSLAFVHTLCTVRKEKSTYASADTDCLDAIQKLLQTTILRTAGHTAA